MYYNQNDDCAQVVDEWIDDEIDPAFSINSFFQFLDCQIESQ
jgi:hypothetical protein